MAIESSIADAATAADLVHARLKLAIYLARSGETSRAGAIVDDIRRSMMPEALSKTYAVVNLAESVVAFFSDSYDLALQKVLRSEAICSTSPACKDVLPLVRAWRAHYETLADRWEIAAALTRDVLENADKSDHEALGRVSIVIANSYEELNETSIADKWYGRARNHALALGDDAAVEAILFNRAVSRVHSARMAEIDGQPQRVAVSILELETASAGNFGQYTGMRSIQWMLDLLRGQVHLLQRRYVEAKEAFTAVTLRDLSRIQPNLELERRADVALCSLMIDDTNFSPAELVAVEKQTESMVNHDSCALILFRLFQCYERLDDSERSAYFLQARSRSIEIYRQCQVKRRETLILHTELMQ